MRDIAAFCLLLRGLLNIDSALTLIRFASRDDADDPFFAILISYSICVDDKQHRFPCGSNCVPPLRASRSAILSEDCVQVVENQSGSFKVDAMLASVQPVLFAVPFEPHGYT